MPSIDWTLMQSFAAMVETGSLAAAARKTGRSQPTMSRHVAALESQLGVRLFDRTATGLVLTDVGLALFEDASIMAQAAHKLSLVAAGRSEAIQGTVRITASETVALWILPAILTRLRALEPDISIELVSSDHAENLLQREADIAVRMFQPKQAELIARKVASVRLGMFASQSYLDRNGTPQAFEDLRHHTVISGDVSTDVMDGFRGGGVIVSKDFFGFRSDSRGVQWQMVLAGFGIGFVHVDLGNRFPDVVRVLPETNAGQLDVWLTTHAELRTSRRIRRVYDFLADELSAAFGAF